METLKVIQVFKPLQDENTKPEDVQLIDGIKKKWCVITEQTKIGESYFQWLLRKKEEVIKKYNETAPKIDGIYLYDIKPINGIISEDKQNQTALFIRWALIR